MISKAILQIANIRRKAHSHFESFHQVLIKKNVIISVIISTQTEKMLSLNNISNHHDSHQLASKQVGERFNGVITELIHIIHNTLKISEPTTFQTHISYFFLAIAATVAANSGSEVHAATMVAHIAHSDTQKYCAIKTAAFTTKSDERTSTQRLAINFVKLSNIPNLFSEEFLFLLKKREIRNIIVRKHRNMIQYSDIQRWIQ